VSIEETVRDAPVNAASGHARRQGVLPLVWSMLGTRVELAAIDIEAHLQATLVALLAAFVAVVLALVAVAFIGVAVIVFFWDTHRVAAAVGVMGAYVAIAGLVAWLARRGWKHRPPALAATLRELELDREALRSGL
jgi:uncharacterized membrane protein YqjE